jgi:hypothetical protein
MASVGSARIARKELFSFRLGALHAAQDQQRLDGDHGPFLGELTIGKFARVLIDQSQRAAGIGPQRLLGLTQELAL